MSEEEFVEMATKALNALIDGGSDSARETLREYRPDDLQHLAHYCEILAHLCQEVFLEGATEP